MARQLNPDSLDMRIFTQRLQPVLPANPAHFVAAKRGVEREHAVRIDPNRARPQGMRHPMRALYVAGPHASGETIRRETMRPMAERTTGVAVFNPSKSYQCRKELEPSRFSE